MLGDLPPSSNVTGIMLLDAYCIIRRPVVVSPMKATLLTLELYAKGLPASGPKPCTILTTPSGIKSLIRFMK